MTTDERQNIEDMVPALYKMVAYLERKGMTAAAADLADAWQLVKAALPKEREQS